MLPIILSIGPITIRSFGLFLAIAFLACLFVVWRRAREEGFSEERVFDTFFLATFALIVLGRFGYVYFNPAIFQPDLGRALLLFRYPGLSFSSGILAASVVTLGVARLFSLPLLMVLDIFFHALTLASSVWFMGCFLDGCYSENMWAPLILAGCFLVLFGGFSLTVRKLRKSPDLYPLFRRPGWITLCYLIFSSVSFLITSYIFKDGLSGILVVAFGGAFGTFVFRYFDILKGVQWLSFPKAFLHKFGAIWRVGIRSLKRESKI